jgi:GH15 family glucan-1,4-alpha-glucosidase
MRVGVLLALAGTLGAGTLAVRGPALWLRPAARVTLDRGTTAQVAAEAAGDEPWLSGGTIPAVGTPSEDMVRRALLDLRALTTSQGASTAGRSALWRYVWPRDASFVAAALARTGHLEDAESVLLYLQRMPFGAQGFQARYLPDGSGAVPDARGPELDGAGWVLWAAWTLVSAEPDPLRAEQLAVRLAPMTDRCDALVQRLTANGRHLPPPSKDYWEVSEHRVTLGTAAPLLAGLQAAARLHRVRSQEAAADADDVAAGRFADTVTDRFAPGYPRRAGGIARDAAVAFLLPPFVAGTPAPAVLRAWRAVQVEARRPAGGLAPGAGWKQDGISWTPETALFALTAAATGDRATAERWLAWLSAHRTSDGALPEKVLADGSPSSVAPLAWTAATVVLSAVELYGPGVPSAGR